MNAIDLSGKTAIVTGASQGLGQAIAEKLWHFGANVVINFFDDPQQENRANAEHIATTLGERCSVAGADVRNLEQIEKMFSDAIQQFGSVDILVNNAGILRDRSVKKMSQEEWRDVIDTNLTGTFNCCQQAATKLADHGRIINIASLSAAVGMFGQANYSSAKAGVIALTKVLSKELASRGILANAIAPGVVMTEMGKSIPPADREKMLEQIPLKRFGEPDEIAAVALFLASDLSSYVTGQTIHVNGGCWG